MRDVVGRFKGDISRRAMVQSLAAAALLGCDADDANCVSTPEETAGPYPGDGSNGPNILAESGVVRSDLRSSLTGSAVADGVSLTVTLTLVNNNGQCAPLAGYAVYLWHADAEGRYSMYSSGVESEDYLRGVQVSADDGTVTFQTVFPGCYDGRWPHIHFEVYESLDEAIASGSIALTSQLALPEDACRTAYVDSRYATSVSNLEGTSLSEDNVFGDDEAEHQLASVSGSVAEGFVATLAVSVEG